MTALKPVLTNSTRVTIWIELLFHFAFPIADLALTKAFYVDGLGCIPDRETRHALILNLYGHKLVAHMTKELLAPRFDS